MRKSEQCYREQLIKFPKRVIRPTVWRTKRIKTVFGPHRRTIDYRMDLLTQQLYVRLRPNPWIITRIFPKMGRYRKRWEIVCPSCLGYAKFFYLHDSGAVHCAVCEPLPSMTSRIKRNPLVRRAMSAARVGDMSTLEQGLSTGGQKAFRIRQAMELLGLLPQLYTPRKSYVLSLIGSRTNDLMGLVPLPDEYYIYSGGELLCRQRSEAYSGGCPTGTAPAIRLSSGAISLLHQQDVLSSAELQLIDT